MKVQDEIKKVKKKNRNSNMYYLNSCVMDFETVWTQKMVRGVRVVNKVAGVMLLLELKKLILGETQRDDEIDIDFEEEVDLFIDR